ncbi:MAG TPA: S8 family serine peptidase, partial [Gemmataceae bacterium]|nr:S8 family serine peptidase [Gemmataceae bacterium]
MRKYHPVRVRLFLELLETRALLSGDLTGNLVLSLKPGLAGALADTSEIALAAGARLQPTSIANVFQVIGAGNNTAALLQRFAGDANVRFVEPETLVHTDLLPNDPKFQDGTLWGLNGANGIQAPAAWDVTTGSSKMVIADIDTGMDYNHPDLYLNVWLNDAEIPASRMNNLIDVNGDGVIDFRDLNDPRNQGPGKITDVNGDGRIDAADILAPMIVDANGNDTGAGGWVNPQKPNTQDGDTAHPDDLVGWNFVANNNNPFDDNQHGTHTAGTIGAVGNNSVG